MCKSIELRKSSLLLLVSLFLLLGCSENSSEEQTVAGEGTPSQTPVETAVEPVPEPEPAAELPEVVVVYGREDFVPWLESEDWWGREEKGNQLEAPHVILAAIHPSWQEYSKDLPVQAKKELFYRLMLPLVMHANQMVTNIREGILAAREEYGTTGKVSEENMVMVRRAAILLPDMTGEETTTLSGDDPNMANMLEALLYRMDIVPAGLALGQAAYESGYGTSRFAIEGNSLFGQWTYKGEGIKPKEQRTSSKGDHRIKAFEWPFDSVRGYFINLMSHPAYEDFRRLRAELRESGEPLDSMRLADGLLRYSERGKDYVDSLKGIMRVNNLVIADDAVFRDEPLRFLISEASREDVVKTEARIAEAAKSGELAEIIERMRLE